YGIPGKISQHWSRARRRFRTRDCAHWCAEGTGAGEYPDSFYCGHERRSADWGGLLQRAIAGRTGSSGAARTLQNVCPLDVVAAWIRLQRTHDRVPELCTEGEIV